MLEVKNLTKSFLGTQALTKVDFKLEEGSIHALMGENGAGKSTFMKILAGTEKADEGEIFIDGKKVVIDSVASSQSYGLAIVYQELSLFPNLTVAQNLFAMQEQLAMGRLLIDDKKMEKAATQLLLSCGVSIVASRLVSELSISERQLIEIAKAVKNKPRYLILDEPTSSLSVLETETLFTLIRKLKKEGCGIIYISHKMGEIFNICDEVTVLRDGAMIGSDKVSNFDQDTLIKMIIGRELEQAFPPRIDSSQEEQILRLEGLSCPPFYHDVSFSLKKGEIYGLYGLVGSGRSEIMKGLFGILPPKEGKMFMHNQQIKINSPHQALAAKLAFITENRKEEGLILSASIQENISMLSLDSILQHGLISRKKEQNMAKKHMKKLAIKAPSFEEKCYKLSGGNQQKVVLSKWFERDADIFIFDEPTRGIDVGAKFEIYQIIQELARAGKAIIFISSELVEVLHICQRIGIVYEGTIIYESFATEVNEELIFAKITAQGMNMGVSQ